MKKFPPITKGLHLEDIKSLIELAKDIAQTKTFNKRALELLNYPSLNTKKTIIGDFKRRFVKEEPLKKQPLIIFYNYLSSTKIKNEILYLEYISNEPLVDFFIREYIYNKLIKPSKTLTSVDFVIIKNQDFDIFLNKYIANTTERGYQLSRTLIRSSLRQFGILQDEKRNRSWKISFYKPDLLSFFYGVFREFFEMGERKRSEKFFKEESLTMRRFLISPDQIPIILHKLEVQQLFDIEIFGTEKIYRLKYPNLSEYIQSWG